MRHLFYMDNLDALQLIADNSVDLIYADPPFNSKRNYKKDDIVAFTDIWHEDESITSARAQIKSAAGQSEVYSRLNACLRGFDTMLVQKEQASLRAYLIFMSVRIAEMWRVLKDTGSIYLHIDPNTSHYLKCVMDAVFSTLNFRNEIVWAYNRFSRRSDKNFTWMNDIIYFYAKTQKGIYNIQYAEPKSLVRYEKGYHVVTDQGKTRLIVYDTEKVKKANVDLNRYDKVVETNATLPAMGQVWTDISYINSQSIERSGYPTQKPIALLKRIVKASSNKDDIVLDPFCGSGTTLDAAERLDRSWIGIDASKVGIETTAQRLATQHQLIKGRDYRLSTQHTDITLPTLDDLGDEQLTLGI